MLAVLVADSAPWWPVYLGFLSGCGCSINMSSVCLGVEVGRSFSSKIHRNVHISHNKEKKIF